MLQTQVPFCSDRGSSSVSITSPRRDQISRELSTCPCSPPSDIRPAVEIESLSPTHDGLPYKILNMKLIRPTKRAPAEAAEKT